MCSKKMLLAVVLAVSSLVACTKEKPFEFVPNKETVSKGLFSKEDYGDLKDEEIAKLSPDEKRKFRTPRIAVMSYGQATRTATASMPYFQGRTKLVEFEISENNIEVRELEKDPRFTDNATNSKTIMVLPVRHVDYDCDKDAYGECQNKEVEDTKKHWKDRRFVEIDFANAKILDADELPVEITNLFSGCYSEGNQKLINYELDKGVFNYEVQKSYALNLTNPECFGEVADFEDFFEKLNFDVRYVYSMVRADQLATADYEAIKYKTEDEGTFGFFNSRVKKLDVDNNEIENNDEVFLNRWNPKRRVITYHLSDEFNNPEYDYVLSATQAAVNNVNAGLAQAETGLRIELSQPSGKKVGDLRNNMIVLVDDPLASRIIGYGPSVAHPLTGEIVNARTVMYLGTIKGIVKKTYEDMREELLAEKEKAKPVKGNILAVVEDLKHSLQVFTNGKSKLASRNSMSRASVLQASVSQMNLSDKTDILKARSQIGGKSSRPDLSNAKIVQIKRDVERYKNLEKGNLNATPSKFIDKRLDVLSKNNVYPEELFNARHALRSAGIEEKLESNLKPWDQLSSAEKEQIIREVLPHIWIPTLVHEIGHNLGLRHNFAGSEDKENFYSKDELNKMGVAHDIPYSSMMEYSYKSTNELPTLGKYDLAALRFAYKREVEAVSKNGAVKLVNVDSDIAKTKKEVEAEGLALKEYRYCTDEHVSANPTCNRFDEGTNLVEIATHFITSYEDNYRRINKRNGRRNFSLYQEGGYLGRMAGNFYDLRLMFELYERIKNDYGLEDGHAYWKEVDFLKEIYEASTMGGQFLLSVLLTPDVHCAIALEEEPKVPVALFQIKNLDPYATTCFHPNVEETVAQIGKQNNLNLVVVGEGEKSFQSRKDPLNENAYADQIDVQGVWIDKMLAMEFLFTRELGSSLFDSNVENYLTHGSVGPYVENIMAAILLGRGAIQVPFRDSEGFPVKYIGDGGALTSTLPVSLEFGEDHRIQVPLISGISRYFGMPNEQTTFQREMLSTMARLVPARINSVDAKKFLSKFSVFKDYPGKDVKFITATVGDEIYFALESNKIATTAIQSLGYARVLAPVTMAEAEKLIEMKKKAEKLPENAEERLKKAYELSEEILKAYVGGVIKSPALYEELLDSLIVSVR